MAKTLDKEKASFRRIALVAAYAVILLGGATAAMWFADRIWPDAIPPTVFGLKLNAALALMAAGLGLVAAMRRSCRVAAIAGSYLVLVGLGTLLQYAAGLSFGLDELLLRDTHAGGDAYPGRISAAGALALVCAGAQLLLCAAEGWRRPWLTAGMELLSFLVFSVGAIGLIGHLKEIPDAYDWGGNVEMPPQAALGFMTLGIGLMALAWHGQDAVIARISPWIPPIFCVLLLVADTSTPHGIASGIAYVPLVCCSLWFTRAHVTFVLATIATCLLLFGFFVRPATSVPMWISGANRVLALAAVWVVATLIYLRLESKRGLSRTRKRLESVVTNVLDGLLSVNARGIIEDFNPACERIFGYDAKEVIGRNVSILMPEAERSGHDAHIARYLKGHAPGAVVKSARELMAQRKDGTVFPIELSVGAFLADDGLHFSGVVRDITERKRAEADLLRYTQALERSNKELDDFAYVASHDLKEPLRGLSSNAQFLQEDYTDKLDEPGIRRLQRLRHLSKRMEHLVNDLLYYSRLGRQELAIAPTDLNAVIRDILSMMETTLQEENAVITVPRRIPEVVCDRVRITEVFRNLITNAIKYNKNEKKIVEIGYIQNYKTNTGVTPEVFYVKDNGIGIEEQFHEDVFRMFKRLNEEDETKRGDGVGLAFVRKIIERHGGRIWLESEPGQGTTFYFTLTQEAAHAAA